METDYPINLKNYLFCLDYPLKKLFNFSLEIHRDLMCLYSCISLDFIYLLRVDSIPGKVTQGNPSTVIVPQKDCIHRFYHLLLIYINEFMNSSLISMIIFHQESQEIVSSHFLNLLNLCNLIFFGSLKKLLLFFIIIYS